MSRASTLEAPPTASPPPVGPPVVPALGGDGGDGAARPPASAATIAVWLLVGTITILFAAFTSTYLVRRSEADWATGPLPAVLWLSTGIMLVSSLSLEWTRRSGWRGGITRIRTGLITTAFMGAAFLAAQLLAWRELASMGLFLTSNPHSAFFYLLTAAHGLHLAGGLGALAYAVTRTRKAPSAAKALRVVEPVAVYWHFLDGLWLYLFVILFAL